MTFVSLADASRRLTIDAKTLRRWLADEALPLCDHPRDGRKKGLSEEHLQQLARLHHRSLLALSQACPAPAQSELPPLPAELLALPEMVGALQVQIAALQQQVADLTSLLQPLLAQPPCPKRTATSPNAAGRSPTSASPVPPSRPKATIAAKAPPKPAHVIPRVEYHREGRYVVICPKRGVLPFEPDTEPWFAWVAKQESFRFVGRSGHFTAHHEWRIPKGAWRAHRHIRNRNHVQRLAPNHELTIAVLERAAEALQAHLTTP